MAFDITSVLQNMAGAVKDKVTTAWPQVQDVWKGFVQTNEDILQNIADGRISGQLTDAQVQSYMTNMKNLLQSQLLALEIMAEAIAQGAANAALDVFWAAVKAAIPAI